MIVTAAQILAAAGEDNPRHWPGPTPKDKGLVTTVRAARILNISAVTLRGMARNGLIDRVRIGTVYYYRLADVLALMERAS